MDIIFVIVSVTQSYSSNSSQHVTNVFDVLGLIFIIIFFIELILRIFVQMDNFAKHWLNIIDGLIITLSFLITLILFIIDNNNATKSSINLIKLITIGRIVRVFLLIRSIRIILQTDGLQKGMRLCVRGNKRGYRKDGFDLDLCYVTRNP